MKSAYNCLIMMSSLIKHFFSTNRITQQLRSPLDNCAFDLDGSKNSPYTEITRHDCRWWMTVALPSLVEGGVGREHFYSSMESVSVMCWSLQRSDTTS